MKRTAKLLALVLALATVMTFGLTFASAAGGTITITDPINGATYKAYRILEFQPDPDGDGGVYKLIPGTWTDFFKQDSIRFTQGEDPADTDGYIEIDGADYVTKHGTWTSDSTEAKALTKAACEWLHDSTHTVGEPAGTATAAIPEGSTTVAATITVDKDGYYLVDTNAGALCSINTNNPNVNIKEKNTAPSVEKYVDDGGWQKDNDAAIGDIVAFKAEITIGTGAQKYKLTDTMQGMTYFADDTHKFKVAETENGDDIGATNYTLNATVGQASFTLSFGETEGQTYLAGKSPGAKLYIYYFAKITTGATIGGNGNDNQVELKYGDNMDLDGGTKHTTTYVWSFNIWKFYKKNNVETALPGAEFELYKASSASGTKLTFELISAGDASNPAKYRYLPGATPVSPDDQPTPEASAVNVRLVVPASGKIVVEGLDSGTYTLDEAKVPGGYTKPAAVTFEIKDDDAGTNGADKGKVFKDSVEVADKELDIENETGALLPSTGSTGTKALVAIGSILVLVSVIFLVTKKKMSTYVA